MAPTANGYAERVGILPALIDTGRVTASCTSCAAVRVAKAEEECRGNG